MNEVPIELYATREAGEPLASDCICSMRQAVTSHGIECFNHMLCLIGGVLQAAKRTFRVSFIAKAIQSDTDGDKALVMRLSH